MLVFEGLRPGGELFAQLGGGDADGVDAPGKDEPVALKGRCGRKVGRGVVFELDEAGGAFFFALDGDGLEGAQAQGVEEALALGGRREIASGRRNL